MNYIVPAPLMSRLAEFLEDHPSATSARIKIDLNRMVTIQQEAPPAPYAPPAATPAEPPAT